MVNRSTVAIAILITAVVVAVVIFALFEPPANVRGDIQIESMDLTRSAEGEVNFTITIKNTGGKTVVYISVEIDNDSVITHSGSLPPNQSLTLFKGGLDPNTYLANEIYQVTVEADFFDGCCIRIITSISCRCIGPTKAQVQIENMDLVKPTIGNAVFSITIKNTGNKPSNHLTVKLGTTTIADEGITLQPGQSVAFTKDNLSGYIVGEAYIVTVEATFLDGSTMRLVATVYCRS